MVFIVWSLRFYQSLKSLALKSVSTYTLKKWVILYILLALDTYLYFFLLRWPVGQPTHSSPYHFLRPLPYSLPLPLRFSSHSSFFQISLLKSWNYIYKLCSKYPWAAMITIRSSTCSFTSVLHKKLNFFSLNQLLCFCCILIQLCPEYMSFLRK